jgi:penicillin-binding protein 1A
VPHDERHDVARKRRFWNYPRPHKGVVQRWLPSWRIVVGTLITGTALGAGLFVAAWSTTTVPSNMDSINHQATTVYWANGKELGTFAEQKREKIALADLPPYVGNAVVASEDSTFWTNNGVDVKGIARAAVNNVKGGNRQGASTLTQQYVERTRTDTMDDSSPLKAYAGKARESIIALKIAQSVPKEEVLEGYLNTIYWGRGTYGIQTASQEYFGKDAADLTPSEAAMLSGIIPAPVAWDPSVNLDQAKLRWQRSIERMHAQGYITDEEFSEAEFPEFKEKKEATNSRGGQKGYLLEAVRKELVSSGRFTEEELATRGLKITTTISPKLQKAAVEIEKSMHTGGTYGKASKNARMSLVSIDPRNGAVRALYGGPDYVKQALNTATDDVVQAGSTFKPFTLIGALEQGHTLNERFDGNSPKVFPEANNGEDWEVPNFGGIDYGRSIDLVDATAHSVNTAYVQLNEEIGPQVTAEVAHRAGIREDTDIPAGLSNVLGTASVYPIDLARAYSTIASGGYRTTPHVVSKVETLDGTTVYEAPNSPEKVFEPDTVAEATYAMTHVVEEGSGDEAQALDRPVAGKTGTSNDNRSAWFAGFVPQLTTVVGLRQYETLDLDEGVMAGQANIDNFGEYREITGGSWPVQAWTDFMQIATEDMEIEEFPEYVPPTPTASPTPSPTPTPTETEEQTVTVPDVVGQQIAQASRALQEVGLQVRTQAQNADQPKGTVLQMSMAGQTVPRGSTITLVVSTGKPEAPEQVVVPNVVGQPRTSAEQALRGEGLKSSVVEEYSDQPVGTVLATNPGAGASVPTGSKVTVVVSRGPEPEDDDKDKGGGKPKPSPSPTPTDDGAGEDDGGGGGLFGNSSSD